MGVTSFLLVSCLGLAITAQAQDCSKPASGPNMSLNDEYILLNSFKDGTRVSFKCNVGYTTAGGSSYITCTAGSWSRLTLICERKSCGSLDEKPNSVYNYSEGIDFGDKLVITCAEGYMMPGAEQKKELICGDQGWIGRQPVCEALTCDPPPRIVDGSYNPINDHYTYREVVQYSCQTNLVLNGSKTRTCSEDGTFQPAAPICVSVECKEPAIANGEWIGGSRPPHKYQSSVTYKCKEGYKMEGSPNQICGINSQWSPGLPECKHPKIENADQIEGSPPYRLHNTVTFKCKPGYEIIGAPTMTCDKSNEWTPVPTCKKLPTTTTTTTTTITPPTGDSSSPKSWAIAVGVLGMCVIVVVVVVVIAVIICIIFRKKRGRDIPVKEVENEEGVELSGKHNNPVASMLN